MNLNAHGTYELTLKGEIFIIRFFEKWNLFSVQTFSDETDALTWLASQGLVVSMG